MGAKVQTAALLRGDALSIPLRDDSVDLIVTSPPYFALRSYTDGGEHYDGQIGSEPTPQAFLEALWAVTEECKRVLKPSGSMWVNLGDKYVAGTSAVRPSTSSPAREHGGLAGGAGWHATDRRLSEEQAGGIRTKSLMGLPWRYAIGCIDNLDLILRAEVVWSKPNGLPESVTDRVRRSHEQWFHFTKEPRYFAAVDEVREPQTGTSHYGRKDGGAPPEGRLVKMVGTGERGGVLRSTNPEMFNPLGKLPGSVWTIPSEPLKVPDWLGVDHFAAFPQEWPRRIILGWSPSGICTACGEGRRPVVDVEYAPAAARGGNAAINRNRPIKMDAGAEVTSELNRQILDKHTTITGYACACDDTSAPTRPAVILDPFGGTGTVAMVARALGRFGVSMDLSADYLRLAPWRVFESRHWMKTVARTHGQQNDKGEWKRPPKRDMVKGTMVHVDGSVVRCWDCGWEQPVRSETHGAALARSHAKVCG